MSRLAGLVLVVACLVAAVPAPADDPEVPEKYISVDEVKALLDMNRRVLLLDVRTRDQFDELHITGAQNLPLRDLPGRLAEVSRQDFVVLY